MQRGAWLQNRRDLINVQQMKVNARVGWVLVPTAWAHTTFEVPKPQANSPIIPF